MSAFHQASQVYEEFGSSEPFFAVISNGRNKRSHLDVDRFYEKGRAHISALMQKVADKRLNVSRQRALDFGCGVGRLTYALADYFSEVVGVDVSSTMVATAEEHRERPNCKFVINKQPHLQMFPDNYFSFIYSDITIQHIPAPASETYIREFVRVLENNGVAIFLVPDGPAYRRGGMMDRWNRYYRENLRPSLKRWRGKYPVQLHCIPRQRVEELISQASGTLLHVEATRSRRYSPILYWVTKRA